MRHWKNAGDAAPAKRPAAKPLCISCAAGIFLYDHPASADVLKQDLPRQFAREDTMSAFTTRIAVVALLFSFDAVAAADTPPKFDVVPSCNAAARGAISVGRDREACLADERTAENVLTQNWSKYDAADKTQCIGNVKTGGPASYVELLSCLEIMRDAKAIRAGEPLAPSDQPLRSPPRRRR